MAKLHLCVMKVKVLFNHCCSSHLAVFTNHWEAVMEQSEGRGQIELQLVECKILSLLIYLVTVEVCVCVYVCVVVTENANRRTVEMP